MYQDYVDELRRQLISDITEKFKMTVGEGGSLVIDKVIPGLSRGGVIYEDYLERLEMNKGVLCGVVRSYRGAPRRKSVTPLNELNVHLQDFYALLKIAEILGI